MKKLYFLFLSILVMSISFGQDLVISGIIDGPLPGGTPKGLELYVVNNIADLSIYGLESSTNGAAASGEEFTFPVVSATAGDFIYVATEAPNFTQYLGVAPDYVDGVLGVNGDDPVILYKNGVIEDIIGTFTDGTGESWEYLDGWAYRVDGQGPSATYSASEWTFSGPNAIDGCDLGDDSGTNAGCGSVFPIGTYSPTANTNPNITVGGNVTGLDYFFNNGPSAEQSFNVGGSNLVANLIVAVNSPFAISENMGGPYSTSVSLMPSSGTVATTPIYVILENGEAVGPYSDDATISSSGATSQTVGLSGTVSPADPQITITGTVGSLDYAVGSGGPSTEDSFFVSALFLQANLTVTAPTDFEVATDALGPYSSSVSFSPDGGGNVNSSEVFIRLSEMLTVGPYGGDVTASSTGAPDQTLAVSGNVFGANTNAMVITGAYDGPLSGGTPKGVELYVLEDIPDLSLFGLGSANNGGGTDGQEFTFPSVSATAGDFLYVSTEATNFTAFFGFAPDYTDGSMGINGDDAVELFENGTVIDVFGTIDCDPNVSMSACPEWEHTDGWAYRNDSTGPDGETFVLASWTFSGTDAFDGETTNGTATTPFPIGTYMETLSIDRFNNYNFKLSPNPAQSGFVTISTSTTDIIYINVFDVLGQQVINTQIEPNNNLDVSNLRSGLYIVKITQNNASVTKKLVIK